MLVNGSIDLLTAGFRIAFVAEREVDPIIPIAGSACRKKIPSCPGYRLDMAYVQNTQIRPDSRPSRIKILAYVALGELGALGVMVAYIVLNR